MPEVNLPLSGPWSRPSTSPGRSRSPSALALPAGSAHGHVGSLRRPQVEREVLAEAGSYGRQLGRIGDALLVLLKDVDLEKLSEAEAEASASSR